MERSQANISNCNITNDANSAQDDEDEAPTEIDVEQVSLTKKSTKAKPQDIPEAQKQSAK
jgi:hypothetical protein